jgi:hypothetical protein
MISTLVLSNIIHLRKLLFYQNRHATMKNTIKSSNLTMIGNVSYILSILICKDMRSCTLLDALFFKKSVPRLLKNIISAKVCFSLVHD